jgi:hypothetical protein
MIRTRDPSNQAAADLRLRPRGHWNMHYYYYYYIVIGKRVINRNYQKVINCFDLIGRQRTSSVHNKVVIALAGRTLSLNLKESVIKAKLKMRHTTLWTNSLCNLVTRSRLLGLHV